MSLLNDREAGEDFETIILTLRQNELLTPSNIDQILLYPTVQITIQDNDCMFAKCYNYSACPHLAPSYIAETASQHRAVQNGRVKMWLYIIMTITKEVPFH